MNTRRLIWRSFLHYFRKNLSVAFGVAIGTAVIAGALILGDSMNYSLKHTVDLRLGSVSHSLTAGDRYFTSDLADKMVKQTEIHSTPLMILEGMAVAGGGQSRVQQVQIVGLRPDADPVFGLIDFFGSLQPGEVIINTHLAAQLGVSIGEQLLFRIRKASLIPMNAPFVSDDETSVAIRVTIKAIAGDNEMGRFDLNQSQSAPLNAFFNLDHLSKEMDLVGRVNTILFTGSNSLATKDIESLLAQNWSPKDLSLTIQQQRNGKELELSTDRVFLERQITHLDVWKQLDYKPVLTYFVNSIEHRTNTTPYSFISTQSDQLIGSDEIVVNNWLADDLGASIDDTIKIKYFVIGPLRELVEEVACFRIMSIVPIQDEFADPTLVPDLPGLSDAGDCRDWETGIPIDLDLIRAKDEDYWDQYKGVPKAFISISTAEDLWENRFGDRTALRFNTDEISEGDLIASLKMDLDPKEFGFQIRDVQQEGMAAAENGTDFSQLFIGLSFFLLVAGILLTALLFMLNINSRTGQIGTLSTLGYSKKRIKTVLAAEVFAVSLVGSLVGIGLSLAYNIIIFRALNSIWQDIVRTDVLILHIGIVPIFIGFLSGLFIAWLTLRILINRLWRRSTASVQKEIKLESSQTWRKWKKVIAFLGLTIAILLVGYQVIQGDFNQASLFFTSGSVLLLSLLLIVDLKLTMKHSGRSPHLSVYQLSLKNRARNRGRSLTILILLSLGTFVVISTGANRKSFEKEALSPDGGAGGYLLFAETSVPILKDLNDQAIRGEFSLREESSVVQFMRRDGEDASCLNLNRVSQPAILGVDPKQLIGRFRFATSIEQLDHDNPWSVLSNPTGEGIVMGIADQTVIQWGLGKKVGDTLTYIDELGDEMRVVLAGGLAPSVFQGNVLISKEQLLKHYPSHSGTSVFLIEGSREHEEAISQELYLSFRDYGWTATPAAERLAKFYSIQNTYLSIFLIIGIIGLMLGTLGMAIILARTIQERKGELALFRALGYSKGQIRSLLIKEFSGLLILGALIGFVSALTAILPSLVRPDTDTSVIYLLVLIAILLVNGLFWIAVLTTGQLSMKNLVQGLRND